MTNADIIRNMSDKELAKVINTPACYRCAYHTADNCDDYQTCYGGILLWLSQEEQEAGENFEGGW